MKWTILLSLFAFSNASFIRDHYDFDFDTGTLTLKGEQFCPSGILELPANVDGSPVTSIGERAFYGCTELTEIVLPETLQTIETRAFAFSGLTKMIFPKELTRIENDAFTNSIVTMVTFLGLSVSVAEHGFRGVNLDTITYFTLTSTTPHIDNVCDDCHIDVFTCDMRVRDLSKGPWKLEGGECVCEGEVAPLYPALCCATEALLDTCAYCIGDKPVHNSGVYCISCMESLGPLGLGYYDSETGEPSIMYNYAQKVSYVEQHDTCTCPYIFADKFCNVCPTPTYWGSATAPKSINDWQSGFLPIGQRGECINRNPEIGKYFQPVYTITGTSYSYDQIDCPAGTSSARDVNSYSNRVRLSTIIINDVALNLDVGEIGTLYKQFIETFATSSRYVTLRSDLVNTFAEYHFYTNVCPVCPFRTFSRAGQEECLANCPGGMLKFYEYNTVLLKSMGTCVDECPPGYRAEEDWCARILCDPNQFPQADETCADCPVGYISDGTMLECAACSFRTSSGDVCTPDPLEEAQQNIDALSGQLATTQNQNEVLLNETRNQSDVIDSKNLELRAAADLNTELQQQADAAAAEARNQSDVIDSKNLELQAAAELNTELQEQANAAAAEADRANADLPTRIKTLDDSVLVSEWASRQNC